MIEDPNTPIQNNPDGTEPSKKLTRAESEAKQLAYELEFDIDPDHGYPRNHLDEKSIYYSKEEPQVNIFDKIRLTISQLELEYDNSGVLGKASIFLKENSHSPFSSPEKMRELSADLVKNRERICQLSTELVESAKSMDTGFQLIYGVDN